MSSPEPPDRGAGAQVPPSSEDRTVVRRPAAGAASETAALGPGDVLNHTYRIVSLLAEGGMGSIYEVTHEALGSRHVVKVIRAELASQERFVELFRREAGALRGIRHDAVAAYDGLFQDEHGRLFLVMEFVEGRPLADLIAEGPMTVEEVRALRDRLAAGLAAAHDKSIVHRDIAPDNILVPGRRMDLAKIIDFGIVKLAEAAGGTVIGEDFAGKIAFASPEQFGMYGQVDHRSDIYSLGLVLAAAARGAPLDMGKSLRSSMEARRAVPDLAGVPEALRGELAAMLQPDPADRPASMRELAGNGPMVAERRRAAQSGRRPRRLGLAAVALAALLAAVLAVLGYVSVVGPEPLLARIQTIRASVVAALADQQQGGPQLAQRLDRLFAQFACAWLSHEKTDDGKMQILGFVSSIEDRRKLRSALSALPLADEELNVVVHFPPFCKLIRGLADSAEIGTDTDHPTIETDRQSRVYGRSDKLAVTVKATGRYDGYLYVDYVKSDLSVIHLLPSPRYPDNRAAKGQAFQLSSEGAFTIGPPYGRDMILAISTPEKLFDGTPRSQAFDGYAQVLVGRVQDIEGAAAAGVEVLGEAVYIQTHE